jgi:Protein of unknown function (DUF3995)
LGDVGGLAAAAPTAAGVAGYAAAAWALLLVAPHFYWGVGGAAGLDTALNRGIVEHRDGWFLVLTWGIGLLCVAGGVVALATVRPWGHQAPAWLLRGLTSSGRHSAQSVVPFRVLRTFRSEGPATWPAPRLVPSGECGAARAWRR